jgi:Protein of unknown function (DUF1579)
MKKPGLCVVLSVALGGTAAPLAAQGGPALPKPGPEHAVLTQAAGTWDARVETWMAPGTEPSVSTGEETSRVGCGGLCLITDFKGSFMGTSFEGHGTDTYDQAKKKYVGSWVDSMSTGLMTSESTYDAATRTLTGWTEGPDMTGHVTRVRSTTVMKDADTRVFSTYNVGPDGKETLGMRITYTRRK